MRFLAALAASLLFANAAFAGVPAPAGVSASGISSLSGDQANGVVSGAFTTVGPSQPFAFIGQANATIYASLTTTLTTTGGSLAASVATGTGIAPGTSVNSVNVPPGTTWATFSGTSGTLALPTITLLGDTNTSAAVIRGLRNTAGLLGATVSGPGIPTGTTVTAILQPSSPGSADAPQQITSGIGAAGFGIVQISNVPTSAKPTSGPMQFNFALGPAAVTGGTDPAAVFTGAGITYTGSVQLERSFDGGKTWPVANVGGNGTLAQWTAGTPVNFTFTEGERQVLYRLNCTSYTAGNPINYRISETGTFATSLGPP